MSLIVFVLQRKAANLERNGKKEKNEEKKNRTSRKYSFTKSACTGY